MQPFIVQGDKTSHGGTVLSGSSFSDCDGKPIARIGDMCSCPKCKGIFPIAQGDQSNIVDGAPVAYHGCKVACGATLISSQIRTLTTPSAGAVPGGADEESNTAPVGFGEVGGGMVRAYEDAPLDEDSTRFQGRFQLVSAEDGTPIVGEKVRVRSTSGQYVTETTDDEGYTPWVERDAAEALAFDFAEKTK
ncbi:MAG: hypothetical protein JWP72_201 [Massilia sp.]|nr:hypothetical protein [Massilia sp.]